MRLLARRPQRAPPPGAPRHGRRRARRASHAAPPAALAPIASPRGTPAASRSSPVISSRTWRSCSSHCRAVGAGPSAPASAISSGGACRAAAAISDGRGGRPERARQLPCAARRRQDRLAVGGLKAPEVEPRPGPLPGHRSARAGRAPRRARAGRGARPPAAARGRGGRARSSAPPRRVRAARRGRARGARRAPRAGPTRVASRRSSAPIRAPVTVDSAPRRPASSTSARVCGSTVKPSRPA